MEVSSDRFKAGDIARVDLDRLELQRVQYESDLRNRHGQSAHRQDQAAGAAERPHAGGTVRRHRAVRFRRQPDAAGRVSHHRPGQPAGFEGGRCRRWTRPRPITSWRWPTVRPIRPSAWISGAIRPFRRYFGAERQHPAAHFRPQPGRKGAHPNGHRPRRAAARGRPGAGLQRRGFGLLHGGVGG